MAAQLMWRTQRRWRVLSFISQRGGQRRKGSEEGWRDWRRRWRVNSTRQKHLRLPKDGVKGNPVVILQLLSLLYASIPPPTQNWQLLIPSPHSAGNCTVSSTVIYCKEETCLLWLKSWPLFCHFLLCTHSDARPTILINDLIW